MTRNAHGVPPAQSSFLDFTEAEVRALRDRLIPYPELGKIRLTCDLALVGKATFEECCRLQAAIEATRCSTR